MPPSRNDEERYRLATLYATKTDPELETLAASGASLTELAREVLRAEILRRGLNLTVSDAEVTPPPPPTLPIVRVYRDLPDALIAQSILDSAGIGCFLFDENIIRLNWFMSYAVREIKLRVADEDAADAVALLDAPQVSTFGVPGVGEYVEPLCPNCRSRDISFRPLMKRLVYALLYFSLPVPLRRPAWRCHLCGYEWHADEPGNFHVLNWNLIRLLWIIGLAFDFASRIDQFGSLSGWLWIAYQTISAVCLARYAVDPAFTEAFLVGFVADSVRFLALALYFMRFIDPDARPITIFPIFFGALLAGALGGLVLMAFTRLAMFVIPQRKSSTGV